MSESCSILWIAGWIILSIVVYRAENRTIKIKRGSKHWIDQLEEDITK